MANPRRQKVLAVGTGYRKIVDSITSHGTVTAVGVEVTGSYGAEVVKILRSAGIKLLKVNRLNRAARRLKGKSDLLDAYQAAKPVLDGRTKAVPNATDGPVECLRILSCWADSGSEGPHCSNQSDRESSRFSSGKLRAKYRALGISALVTALRRSRPLGHLAEPEYVCLVTLKALAARCHSLAPVIPWVNLREPREALETVPGESIVAVQQRCGQFRGMQ